MQADTNPLKRKAEAGDLQEELPKAAKPAEDDDMEEAEMPQAPEKPVLREAQPSEFKHACPLTAALVTAAYDATKLPKELLVIVAAMADADNSYVKSQMRRTAYIMPGILHEVENSVTGALSDYMPIDSDEKDVLCLYNMTTKPVKLDVRRASSEYLVTHATKQSVDLPAGAFLRLYPPLSRRLALHSWFVRQRMRAHVKNDFYGVHIREEASDYGKLEVALNQVAHYQKEVDRLKALKPVRPPFYIDVKRY